MMSSISTATKSKSYDSAPIIASIRDIFGDEIAARMVSGRHLAPAAEDDPNIIVLRRLFETKCDESKTYDSDVEKAHDELRGRAAAGVCWAQHVAWKRGFQTDDLHHIIAATLQYGERVSSKEASKESVAREDAAEEEEGEEEGDDEGAPDAAAAAPPRRREMYLPMCPRWQ